MSGKHRPTWIVWTLLFAFSSTARNAAPEAESPQRSRRARSLGGVTEDEIGALRAALRAGRPIELKKRRDSRLAPLRFDLPRETPSDPPFAAPVLGPRPVTQPVTVRRGGITSVQVNTDALGRNILGDAANEPSMAIDPTDPTRITIGWRQFDSISSDFRQAGVAYSQAGGATWTSPGVLEPGVFRSDPVLAADASGSFYYSSLSLPAPFTFAVDVFKSADGGQTWPTQTYAFGGDKQWMIVDRTSGPGQGFIYQYWVSSLSCCGTTNFTRSVDTGLSYQGPFTMTPPQMRWGTMTVTPDGTLFAAGAALNPDLGHVVARSIDAQDPAFAPVFDEVRGVYLGGITIGGAVNPAGLLGQVWIDSDHSGGPTDGYLYVLGSVLDFTTFSHDVRIIRSVDGGRTWSDPVRVNDDPIASAWHWFGAMSVAPNGRIDVTWYDTRNDPDDPFDPNLSEVFYSYSLDAGRTWSTNAAITPPFNHFLGYPQQQKLGDYTHMISDLGGANLAYAATFNGEQDVYFVRIPFDCNTNGVEDPEDITNGDSDDCNFNGVPDECEPDLDCNGNEIRDLCEIGSSAADDCDGNLVPDGCQDDADCNNNQSADICDIADGTSQDCNANGIPDECDIASGLAPDRNGDGILDGWQGVCCLCENECLTTTGADCSVRGGLFTDPGFTCVDRTCPPPPANDDCVDAIMLPSDVELSEPFTNRCTTLDGPAEVECDNGFQPFGSDIWYTYRAPCTGELTVSLCNQTSYDSILAVYMAGPACACPTSDATLRACGDDTCGFGGGPSTVTLTAFQGLCYVIRVAGWDGSQGDGLVELILVPELGGAIPGDCDDDGAVNLLDFDPFIECMKGPAVSVDACCNCVELTDDVHVALDDFAEYQRIFDGK